MIKPQPPLIVHAAGAAMLALLTLIAWFVALEPSIHSRAAYLQQAATRESERDTLLTAQAQDQAAVQRLASLQDSLRKHPLMLRNQDDLSGKLQEITELTSKVGVQLASLEAGKSDNYTRHGTVIIQMNARCTLSSLWKFFRDMRVQMPDITVRSIDLAGRYINDQSMPSLTMTLIWHTAPLQVAVR